MSTCTIRVVECRWEDPTRVEDLSALRAHLSPQEDREDHFQ